MKKAALELDWARGEKAAAEGRVDSLAAFLALMPEPYKTYVKASIDFHLSMARETDRGAALMAAGYLDELLKDLLLAHFIDAKTVANKLLSGPLQSFSARIDAAYLLGLLPKTMREDLNIIKGIRNKFAHEAGFLSFDVPEVERECRKLKEHGTDASVADAGALYRRSAMSIVSFLAIAKDQAVHTPPAAPMPQGDRDRRIAAFHRALQSQGEAQIAAFQEAFDAKSSAFTKGGRGRDLS